jgi:hypothetical protein
MAFYQASIAVLRPTTKTNRAEETTLDYSGLAGANGVIRKHVQIRPLSQSEKPDVDRIAGTEIWAIATKPGTGDWDVLPTDWLRLPDGRIAAVEGPPARPSDPQTGKLHHVEVRARRAAG